ncbi:Inositol polyphosphate-related phosphatase domain-containing protein [Plasmodiophora brassicae]
MGSAYVFRNIVALTCVAYGLSRSTLDKGSARIVLLTWNLADGFPDGAEIRQAMQFALHGLPDDSSSLPEFIVIGLQEANLSEQRIAQWVRDAINDHYFKARQTRYEVVGAAASRWGGWIPRRFQEKGHFLSGIVVLRRESSKVATRMTAKTSYCRRWSRGEKAITLVTLTAGPRRFCFLSAHLPSATSDARLACLQHGFQHDELGQLWDACDTRFMIGDFNSRTGRTAAAHVFDIADRRPSWDALVARDEMTHELTGKVAHMRGLTGTAGLHLPTYKMLRHNSNVCLTASTCVDVQRFLAVHRWDVPHADGNCGEDRICYDPTRPVSWTDQILFDPDRADLEFVAAVHGVHTSDHLPLAGRFTVDLD